MNAFKDAGHIFRLAAVFVCGILVFVECARFFVPKSFGQYGITAETPWPRSLLAR